MLVLLSMLLTCFIKADHFEQSAENPTKDTHWLSDVVEPKVIFESVFILLLGLLMGACDTYVVLYAKQMNITNIFLYFIMTTVAEMSTRIFSGKLYDRKGMNILVIPGTIIGLLSCIAAAHATNLFMLCIFALLYGASIGMIFPVMGSQRHEKSKP